MICAPYPPKTRSRGWRFEIDHERIRQSDTWAIAPAEIRPWLLMLWMVAWEQTPCGSLPADDDLIIARIGMPAKMWDKAKPVLMRGWVSADDNRQYHPVLTERVAEMMASRRRDSDRKALARAKMAEMSRGTPAGLPDDAWRNDAGIHRESDTGTGTGTGTSNPTSEKKESAQARAAADAAPSPLKPSRATPARPDDVDPQVWADWVTHRKQKRAPVTLTVLAAARTQAAKAGMPLEAFLIEWCERGSQGLKAEWLKPQGKPWEVADSAAKAAADRAASAAHQASMRALDERSLTAFSKPPPAFFQAKQRLAELKLTQPTPENTSP